MDAKSKRTMFAARAFSKRFFLRAHPEHAQKEQQHKTIIFYVKENDVLQKKNDDIKQG